MKAHLVLVTMTASALAQGPLTPPPGADPNVGPVNALTPGGNPQASMKTLHQIEPRKAIPSGTGTVAITQSGSYYLTGDITVATGAGVVIGASGVTLDLNGFNIVSTKASPSFGDVGVGIGPYVKNITIRNGSIFGGGAGGKFHSGIGSTSFTASRNVTVADVNVSDTTHWGISLDTTSNCRVERCFVETEGVTGAIQARLVNDCSAFGGGIFATLVRNCSVTTNGANGIFADVVENSTSTVSAETVPVKTVFRAEPRTPISSLPFTISQSGSYYLTGNLLFTAPAGDAITITASNVALDLMGFTLASDAAVTGNAIHIPSAATRNISVRNGAVAGNTNVTVSGDPSQWTVVPAGFGHGVRDLSTGGRYENLSITGCRTVGLYTEYGATVRHLHASDNGQIGIRAPAGSVTNSTSDENGTDGISASGGSVTNSSAHLNRGIGIYVFSGSVMNSMSGENGGVGIYTQRGSVTGCTALYNGGFDLNARHSSVAFSLFITSDLTGTTGTGNNPNP
ncbi:MAG: hypothetical protein RLZZ505_2321 [Verrucomicrobiota bacterium]|jgi:hypothetical protein